MPVFQFTVIKNEKLKQYQESRSKALQLKQLRPDCDSSNTFVKTSGKEKQPVRLNFISYILHYLLTLTLVYGPFSQRKTSFF